MSSEASELQDGDGPNRKKIKTNECIRLVFPRAFIEACPDPLTCQIWIRCFSCLNFGASPCIQFEFLMYSLFGRDFLYMYAVTFM